MTILNYFENLYDAMSSINISVVVQIFSFIMYWLLFEKAKEQGWKSLIPYYNEYIIFKIAKKKKLFWWQLAIGAIALIGTAILFGISVFMFNTAEEITGLVIGYIISGILLFVAVIILLVIKVKRSIGLAKAFGQTTAFGIGIFFLEPIFIAIIAISKDIKYIESNNIVSNNFIEDTVDLHTYENQF